MFGPKITKFANGIFIGGCAALFLPTKYFKSIDKEIFRPMEKEWKKENFDIFNANRAFWTGVKKVLGW